MIKSTLYFGNPAYLSLKNSQLIIKLPEVERNEKLSEDFKKQAVVSRPVEDIGIVVLDNKQITITSGTLEALLENNIVLLLLVTVEVCLLDLCCLYMGIQLKMSAFVASWMLQCP